MFEDAEHPSEQQAQQGQHHGSSLIDFFISYRGSDRGWAEWIAWQLERAGYKTIIQAWDFRPGSSFPVLIDEALQQAERVLFPGAYPSVWMVPSRRNALFTGREEVLSQLRELAKKGTPAALTQAITGLGGIGKTQTAVEYAYQYRNQYEAVLGLQADTEENMIGSYQQMARALGLPEQHEKESEQVVAAVKRWFRGHAGWLLIVDNADEPKEVMPYLPQGNG